MPLYLALTIKILSYLITDFILEMLFLNLVKFGQDFLANMHTGVHERDFSQRPLCSDCLLSIVYYWLHFTTVSMGGNRSKSLLSCFLYVVLSAFVWACACVFWGTQNQLVTVPAGEVGMYIQLPDVHCGRNVHVSGSALDSLLFSYCLNSAHQRCTRAIIGCTRLLAKSVFSNLFPNMVSRKENCSSLRHFNGSYSCPSYLQ